MTIGEVKSFFQDKENTPCPLTEKLVKAGFQQRSGGYIDHAKRRGIKVDYKENSPSQYWHLMTYCDSRSADKPFTKSIVCGELIFWMAEVSEAVEKCRLELPVNQITAEVCYSGGLSPKFDRIKWNREIQNICFDKIILTTTSIGQWVLQ